WAFFDYPDFDANFQVADGKISYSTTGYYPDPGSGGEWFYSNTDVANSEWAAKVGVGTSYTMEFSARVTGGSGAVPGLHTTVCNGDGQAWLTVAPDHVAIGNGSQETRVLQGNVDNSTDFHDYRIAFDGASETYRVWRDGILIGKNLESPTTYSKSGVAFGDATSTGYGDAEIDYFRWDPSNDYEPIALTPVPLAEKGSDEFGYQYEADTDLPNVEDSGTSKTNWLQFDYPGFDANFQVADGKLSYSTTGYYPDPGSGGEWFYSDSTVDDSAWDAEVYAGNSFTAEFSAKVTGGEGLVPGLHTIFENGIEGVWLTVDTDHVAIGDGHDEDLIILDGVDNFSDFHTYRLAFDAVSRKFQVWRDGDHIGVDLDAPFETLLRRLAFGDATSQGFGDAEIDYFRWDSTGAYAPVSLVPGDFNGDDRVDVADLGILATYYGGTGGLEQGDANGDGNIDVADLGILATNYGYGTAAASVPEPSVLVGLLSLVLAGCCARRRHSRE
ncbi:MAG: PEP-CTERM sorting domain-containing protein, partial [Planctomycetota bacterium]|nr:PEP-CTERM sorting domain-containing protein [Planctomycetota bacterium]